MIPLPVSVHRGTGTLLNRSPFADIVDIRLVGTFFFFFFFAPNGVVSSSFATIATLLAI